MSNDEGFTNQQPFESLEQNNGPKVAPIRTVDPNKEQATNK